MTQELKPGAVLSEQQFYTLKSMDKDKAVLLTETNEEITVSKEYLETMIQSADTFSGTEKLAKTYLAELLVANPRTAMTVCFTKANKAKTKKAYTSEREEYIQKVKSASLDSVSDLLNNLMDNPILDYIPGGERVIKGYHLGHKDELGRILFIDMEVARTGEEKHDPRIRQIDPRTIQYIIVNGIKYCLG